MATSGDRLGEQFGLFAEPEHPAVRAPTIPAPTGGGVKYSDYKGRERCADCELLVFQEIHSKGGSTHLIRQARTRRTDVFGEHLLCSEHAGLRREAEALAREKKS